MKRRLRWLLLLGTLWLALGLRVYRLEGQSLWYDEGITVALVGRDLATITRSAAADIHPPFYYYALHVWVALTGNSPTAVRALSALIGTALVALTYALGRRLFGASVGLMAAFLAAISPFQVYYSQETRMYILVTALSALSVYAFLRLQYPIPNTQYLRDFRHRVLDIGYSTWPLLFIAATTLALYTHYFAFTVWLAVNLAVLVQVVMRRLPWRGLLPWAALQAAVALLYLPWLAVMWRQFRTWPAISEPLRLGFLLGDGLRVFSLGLSVEPRPTPAVGLFGVLLVLGLLPMGSGKWRVARGERRGAVLIAVLYLFVPFAVLYLLSLRRPLYNPKFLLVATPAFHVLMARGIVGILRTTYCVLHIPFIQARVRNTQYAVRSTQYAIGRALLALFLTLLLLPTAHSLHNYYFDPAYARDDYRGIARTIQALGEPGDGVILNAPGQIEVFGYYYHGDLPRYPLPRQRPPDPAETQAALQRITAQHRRVFGIFWATDESDPQRIVETWLDEHAYKAMDAWYGNVRLVLYRVPQPGGEGRTQRIDARLGEAIELLSATHPDAVTSGDVLPVTLRWRATQPVSERYKVFVQLLSPTNQLMAQRDAEPGGGARLTTTWTPGEVIEDRYGVLVPPGTPPGTYRLIAGMYGYDTGRRLPVTRGGKAVGDFVDLGEVRVERPAVPPPVEALGLSRRIEADYGPVRLLGYALDKRGAEGQRDAPLHPGDALRITLFWQARERPPTDLRLTLRLMDGDTVRAEVQAMTTDGLYPAPQWSPGEVIRDPHDLPLPPDLSPGRYVVQVAAVDEGGNRWGPPLSIPVQVR